MPISSEVPPPVQPPARQQTFPQQSSSRQQLHPPSAHARHARNESKDSISGRPTSSVYSQPSPLHTTFAPQRDQPNVVRHHPDGFDDVSPPSSPELLSPGNVYVSVFFFSCAQTGYVKRRDTGQVWDISQVTVLPNVGCSLLGRRRRHWLHAGGGLRLVDSVSRPGPRTLGRNLLSHASCLVSMALCN